MHRLPYSLPQKEIWAEWLAWNSTAHLQIGGYSKLTGHLDIEKLESALQMLVEKHDGFRLVPNINGHQHLLDKVVVSLQKIDFSQYDDAEQRAIEWQSNWLKEDFVDSTQPPIRYALLIINKQFSYLVIQASHLVMDGWSLSVAPQKWADCYNDLTTESDVLVDTDYKSYQDFIIESNDYKTTNRYQKDWQFWAQCLPDIGEPVFAERYYSDSADDELSTAFITNHHITDESRLAVRQCAIDINATPFHVYVATVALYIFKSLDLDELVIGVPSLNRSGNKYKQTIGMFVGVIPIVIQKESTHSFRALVEDIKQKLKSAYRHAKMPLSDQFKRLKAVYKGRDRLFDIVFSYEEFEFSCAFGDAVLSDTKQSFSGISRYPMAISLCDFIDAQDTEMVIECSQRYFSEQEADLVGARLIHLLKQLCIESRDMAQIDLCTPSELTLLAKLPRTVVPQSAPVSFANYILSHAKVAPKSLALVTQDVQYTFNDLIQASVNLADTIERSGAEVGDVGILALARGPEVVVAMMAHSFLGHTFIPIDLDWPVSRVNNIVKQAQPKHVFINSNNVARYAELNITSVIIDIPSLLSKKADLTKLDEYKICKDAPAYILFTSGSTGEPKGVVVSHEALQSRLNWIVEAWGLTAKDRSLQATQVNFDPALVELLAPLVAGGSVAFPPPGRLLPEWLPGYISEFNATLMAFVPSTLRRFLDGLEPNKVIPLRVCCCGGEVLSYDVAQQFIRSTNATLYNVYGPTEATIFCTAWQVHPTIAEAKSMPVGRPLFGTQLYIVNSENRLQPFGVVGEIMIAGAGVADAYLARKNETQTKFVDLVLPDCSTVRAYRTGDKGWLDCDGVVHFVGRIDRQVKLRGYRIELSEIENALMNIPGVELGAVSLDTSTAKPYISAWFEGQEDISEQRVRTELTMSLPDYMVPERILKMASLPVTQSAKVDYNALPSIMVSVIQKDARQPVGPLENKILEIWSHHIEGVELNVNSHFFEAGGDSLSAVICLNEIEQYVGQRLSLHQLVANPTVASLATVINTQLKLPELLVSLGDTTRQTSLYIAASGNGDLMRFQSLAKCLKGSADIHMLQPPGNVDDITIEELATLYADKIAERGEKSIYLAGFSVGGVVALELAQQLATRGVAVNGLFIVDTILMNMPSPIIWLWSAASKWLSKWSVPFQREAHLDIRNESGIKKIVMHLLGSRLASSIQDHGLLMQVKAMKCYSPSHYDGQSVLIKSSAYRFIHDLLLGGWRRFLGTRYKEVEIHTSHSGFFQPGQVEQLARVIKDELQS